MYLIKADYRKLIQDINLNQVISSDDTILDSAQLTAQAECISYLTQKYQTDKEFTDTTTWSITPAYKAENRVYLTADAYSATSTYVVGALVLQAGLVYRCTIAVTVAEAFNVNKWLLLGIQYAMFYAKYPYPKFNSKSFYNVGDQVWWNDKTYTCRIKTSVLDHDTAVQLHTYGNFPYQNVVPDDPINGVTYWGTGTAYTITAGTNVTDTTKWQKGDNRSQQMVTYLIDITLFHVHSRIAPRNIPQLRIDRYVHAIEWLKMAGQGAITADLPLIQPLQGNRIRWGGNVKNTNSY